LKTKVIITKPNCGAFKVGEQAELTKNQLRSFAGKYKIAENVTKTKKAVAVEPAVAEDQAKKDW